MENRKVVFICAPYDEKDPVAHAKEINMVAHFRSPLQLPLKWSFQKF